MGDGKVRDDGDECGDGDNENNNHKLIVAGIIYSGFYYVLFYFLFDFVLVISTALYSPFYVQANNIVCSVSPNILHATELNNNSTRASNKNE